MKTMQIVVKFFLVGFCLTVWSISTFAQPFDSGSNGSYGAIEIFAQTILPVPSDGIFHATTVDITHNLTFTKNAKNTPIYILATGDINIGGNIYDSGSGSTSQIGGVGGSGGFDGGARGVQGTAPGDGHGPGGGIGGLNADNDVGAGSYGTRLGRTDNDGEVYGTALLMPMVGGSGGGGSDTTAGGGGGGAITIASNTQITLTGTVWVRGANVGGSGDGSAGSIRLVAPKIIGAGTLYADAFGGMGRIRVDLIDRSEYALRYNGSPPLVIGSLMQVFPTTSPSLAIIGAAGAVIVEGSTTPVEVLLPNGAPSSQDVIVQARDFTGLVPIRVKVIPDSGPSVSYDDTIDMGGGNPSTVTVSVQIPVNVPVFIEAWTTNP